MHFSTSGREPHAIILHVGAGAFRDLERLVAVDLEPTLSRTSMAAE